MNQNNIKDDDCIQLNKIDVTIQDDCCNINITDDVRLYKIDVTIEDDYFRVDNIKKVLFNETKRKTFKSITEWQEYFYHYYNNYLKSKKIDDIFLESFYFKHNVVLDERELKKSVFDFVRSNKSTHKVKVKFNF
jgi:hypothetical protein